MFTVHEEPAPAPNTDYTIGSTTDFLYYSLSLSLPDPDSRFSRWVL